MVKNKILLMRSQDILTDSRVQRYEKWYRENSISFQILGWDRGGKGISRENTHYCTIKAGYNMRTSAIKYRIQWNMYLMKYLLKNYKQYDIIHACDFDTVMPALAMKLLGKKVIFDIFDWFSDEVKTGKVLVDRVINTLERLAVKCADVTILCEEERLEQIEVKPRHYIIIPNIPSILGGDLNQGDMEKLDRDKIIITYVGGFYPGRGLEELLHVVSKMPEIHLNIAGFGDQQLEELARSSSDMHGNIDYFGKVEYEKAMELINSSHLLYGMYYKSNRNHIYAAPNKFYEAIFMERPLITTQGTLVGKKVEKDQIGFVIDEGSIALECFLKHIKFEEIQNKIETIKKIKLFYSNRWHSCMETYKDAIQK